MLASVKEKVKDLITDLMVGSPIRRIFLRKGVSTVVILTLHRVAIREHGIAGHRLEMLAEFITRLRRIGVPIVGLDDVVEAMRGTDSLPQLSVCFTLDDGYWDQAEQTVPLLLDHGVLPTVFLITGFLDGQLWPWDARVHELFRLAAGPSLQIRLAGSGLDFDIGSPASRLHSRHIFTELCKAVSDQRREKLISALCESVGVDPEIPLPRHQRPMTWDQARALERRGVRFGSHSVSHCVFSRIPEERAVAELEVSGKRIAEELRRPLPVVAWPIGRPVDFGDRDLALAAQAGYQASATVFSRDVVMPREHRCATSVTLHRHGFSTTPAENLRTIFRLSVDTARAIGAKALGRVAQSDDGMVDWHRVRRLVFVCKGNICRSVYAEMRARSVGLKAISCGVEALPGAVADGAAVRNAMVREVDLSAHRSRRLDQLEVDQSDLLIFMEPKQQSLVQGVAERAGAQQTLASRWIALTKVGAEIPDPYGRDDCTFQTVFESLDELVANLAPRLGISAQPRIG